MRDFAVSGAGSLPFRHAGNGIDNLLAKSQSFWRNAKSYDSYEVPGTGHAVMLHNSA